MAAVAVAVVAVSTSAILVRWSAAPALVKGFYRVLFTTLLLAPLAVSRHGGELRSLSWRDGVAAAATGVALAIHFASWFQSLAWTSVAASVTLVQTQPVFVAIGAALFLDEVIDRRTVVGIVVAVVGIAVMTVSDAAGSAAGPRPLYGNLLAVLGAFMAATYFLAGRSLRQRIDLIPYVTVVYAVCAGVLLVVIGVRGLPLVDYPPRE